MDIIAEINNYPWLVFAIRIVMAGVCGFAIGLERYINNKSAGIRTHVVVCCASALFMIVSIYGFTSAADVVGIRDADPARIAAQVVTGISFLGAGMIFKDGDAIKGLTTAAGIWSTAAIGLAIGAGMYFISIFVTLFVIAFMIFVSKLLNGRDTTIDYRISVTVEDEDDFYSVISEEVKKMNGTISKVKIADNGDNTMTYSFNLHFNEPHEVAELSAFMKKYDEVKNISGKVI